MILSDSDSKYVPAGENPEWIIRYWMNERLYAKLMNYPTENRRSVIFYNLSVFPRANCFMLWHIVRWNLIRVQVKYTVIKSFLSNLNFTHKKMSNESGEHTIVMLSSRVCVIRVSLPFDLCSLSFVSFLTVLYKNWMSMQKTKQIMLKQSGKCSVSGGGVTVLFYAELSAEHWRMGQVSMREGENEPVWIERVTEDWGRKRKYKELIKVTREKNKRNG